MNAVTDTVPVESVGGPEEPDRPRRGRLFRRLRRSPLAMAGFVVLCVAVLAALLAPVLAPYSPDHADFEAVFQPPGSPGHILGTDSLGRDILSRILYGARASLELANRQPAGVVARVRIPFSRELA